MISGLQIPRGKYIGSSVPRTEDRELVTGEAQYVADIVRPRMVHAAFVRSTHAHASIRSIDTAAARDLPGVIDVVTAVELDAAPVVDAVVVDGLLKTPQHVLATDRVRFVGEAVAVIVARDRATAEDAAEHVVVDYEPLPVMANPRASLADGAMLIHDELEENAVFRQHEKWGDPDTAFAQAEHVFSEEIHTNRVNACPMEPRGCLADYRIAARHLTFWAPTQNAHILQLSLAGVLGIPGHSVRVITPPTGGGFGQKQATQPEEVVVAALSRRLGRPVRWIEDRRENLTAATQAKEQLVRVEAAVDADGKIMAFRTRVVGDGGAYSFNAASMLVEPLLSGLMIPGVYDVDHFEMEVVGALTNKPPAASYRAVGFTCGHTVREVLLDTIARRLGLDRAEIRRRNMVTSFPYKACMGAVYDSGSYVESMDKALELIGYERIEREREEARSRGRRIGIGISPFVEPTGFGSEIGQQTGFPLPSNDNAVVTMDASGKVRVGIGITTQGQGHRTVFAQIAADALGAAVEDVDVYAGDTDSAPFGFGTFASRGAVVIGGAVALAAGEVREKLVYVASQLLEAAPQDLVLEDSRVHVAGASEVGMSLADLAGAAYFAVPLRREEKDPYLSATCFYDPRATYANGCVAAVCEVDPETGTVDVKRMVAAEDCGTVINPMIVEGQSRGALAQGIGLALLEHVAYDDEGRPLATTYRDYLLPRMSEVPRMEIGHLESPSPVTVGGIKGMGEGGMVAAPAAIVNAVTDALAEFDPCVDTLPLSPERVLRAAGAL